MHDEFDNFKPRALGFEPNNAWACAHASEAAYMDDSAVSRLAESWGFTTVRFFDAQGTQAFIMGKPGLIVLAFRGTEPDKIEDIATDLRVRKVGGPLAGRVHRGFLMALLSVWDDYETANGKHKGIERALKEMKKEVGGSPAVWVTGHSLGAALATLATAFLLEEGRPVQGTHTFGCPRVGDSEFVTALDARSRKRNYRMVNNNDIVTRVPPRSFGYDHAGEFWYLSENGDLKDDPNSWYLFLDRGLGVLCDIGEVGIDGIKDHSMNDGEDGYIPALLKSRQ
jgi:triacylglycerol lipase